MKTKPPQDPLAAWADAVLRQIPDRRAPASLLPAVLAAVRAQAMLPWYRRTWLQWPPWVQLVSLVLASSGLVAGLCILEELLISFAATAPADAFFASGQMAAGLLATLGRVAVVLGRSVPSAFWIALIGVIGSAWIACLALGTACWKLARLQVHSREAST